MAVFAKAAEAVEILPELVAIPVRGPAAVKDISEWRGRRE
jgi:hypothetical protein